MEPLKNELLVKENYYILISKLINDNSYLTLLVKSFQLILDRFYTQNYY